MYIHVRCFLHTADAGTSVKSDCLAVLYRLQSANLSAIFDVMIWLNYTQLWRWFTFKIAYILDLCPKKKITHVSENGPGSITWKGSKTSTHLASLQLYVISISNPSSESSKVYNYFIVRKHIIWYGIIIRDGVIFCGSKERNVWMKLFAR